MTAVTTPQAPPSGVVLTGTPRRRRRRARWTGWAFVGPFMTVFAPVFLAPIVYSIYLSLFRTQLVGGTQFVGLDNYACATGDLSYGNEQGFTVSE